MTLTVCFIVSAERRRGVKEPPRVYKNMFYESSCLFSQNKQSGQNVRFIVNRENLSETNKEASRSANVSGLIQPRSVLTQILLIVDKNIKH